MKINIAIDCTPEGGSQFIEVPVVSSPQGERINGFREKITESARSIDPDSLMKGRLSGATLKMGNFQKMFELNLSGGAPPEKPAPGKD